MEQFELKNGLQVSLQPKKEAQSVTVGVMVGAGAANDGKTAGIAHFLEHLLFDGSEKYPDINELTGLIENIGGRKNGSTAKEYAYYFTTVLPEDITTAVEYISELIQYPLLKEKDIIREKKVVTAEIRKNYDNPSTYIARTLLKHRFPDQHYGWLTTGEIIDIEKLTKEEILRFYKKHYCARNMTIGVAGSFNIKDATDLITAKFSDMNGGDRVVPPKPVTSTNEESFSEEGRSLSATQLGIQFQEVVVGDLREYSNRVLVAMLVRGFGSKLYKRLRQELSHIYSIPTTQDIGCQFGSLVIQTAVPHQEAHTVLDIIRAEIEGIAQGKFDDQELSRAKQISIATKVFSLEDSAMELRVQLWHRFFTEKEYDFTQEKILFENVSRKDVQVSAKRYLDLGVKKMTLK